LVQVGSQNRRGVSSRLWLRAWKPGLLAAVRLSIILFAASGPLAAAQLRSCAVTRYARYGLTKVRLSILEPFSIQLIFFRQQIQHFQNVYKDGRVYHNWPHQSIPVFTLLPSLPFSTLLLLSIHASLLWVLRSPALASNLLTMQLAATEACVPSTSLCSRCSAASP
jgi:hypothetical protein